MCEDNNVAIAECFGGITEPPSPNPSPEPTSAPASGECTELLPLDSNVDVDFS